MSPMAKKVYVFRAKLRGWRGVRRTIAIPCDHTLDDLHRSLQAAFGWADDHLYAFWLGGKFWAEDEIAYVHPLAPDSAEAEALCAGPRRKGAERRLERGELRHDALALHQATGEARRLEQACEVLDRALAHFADPAAAGTFYDTADDAEALLHRPREVADNATPSGSAALAGALLTASVLVDDPQRYRAPAEAALRSAGTLAERFPRFAGPMAERNSRVARATQLRWRTSE